MYFALLALAAVDLYILFTMNSKKKKENMHSEDEWTVYGTMECPWCRKQKEYMEKKGIPYKFVNCKSGKCPGMDAFPVLESPSGQRTVGYKEV